MTICLWAIGLGCLLCAQDPPPNSDQVAPNIAPLKTTVTVTGTRTATELDRAPVSTSLVTREEMETRNINQIDQALSLIEGVNAYRTRGPSDNDFGIGLRGFAGRGGQSRTLILLDGQPLNNSYTGNVNWALLPIGEFERVEVARGPFSSLYGGNAMGGVVNLITRPVNQRHFELFGQYGSRDTSNYSLHVTDRFFQKLGLSFGYQRYQTGGYEDQDILKSTTTTAGNATPVTGVIPWLTPTGGSTYQVGRRGRDWFNQHAYRGRAEYTFSSKVFASFQYLRASRGAGYDAYNTFLRDSRGNPIDTGLVSFQDGNIVRRLQMAPADYLGLPTGASTNNYQGQILATFNSQWNLRIAGGVNQSPTEWYITPSVQATLTSGTGSYTNQSSRALYGNVQLGWTPNSRHQLIFGTETRHDNARILVNTVPSYTSRANGGPITDQSGGQSVNQAVYVQDQIALAEKLQVVVGGRYDYWHAYDGVSQTAANGLPVRYPERSSNAFTGKVAASYQAPLGFVVRASVGNAFRNPNVYELYRDRALGNTLYLGNPNALPERLLSYDAGVLRRFGASSSIEASYFENRIHDLLYRTTDFDADPTGRIRRLTNAGLGRTRGIELSATEQIFSWLQLKQTYSYTNAIITENPQLPATEGKRIPYVPAHMTSFMALLNRGRWFGSVSGRYQGGVFSTDVNNDMVSGVPGSYNPFFEADVNAGYRFTKQLSVTANVYNLLDRRYYLYYLSPGRQVLVGLRIRL